MTAKSSVYRVRNIVLLVLIFMVVMLSFPQGVSAKDNIKKNTITHDIAIVFDNSGSMYDNTDRWSQSLYAIGVFASMLDYSAGDKLGIYPMGAISIGKDGADISDRLEVTQNNISDIAKIYCRRTSETILSPAYKAKEYLKQSQADEKWLIVLTDGEFYYDKSTAETGVQKDAVWLEKKMLGFTGDGVKVQYLGFAEASVLNSNISNGFYSSNVSSADALTGELVNICNKIFQRHIIQDISQGTFTTDVSMKSIIAFAQGKGAEIKSLYSSDTQKTESSLNMKLNAGTQGTGSNYLTLIADVCGQVVTFGECKAGTYHLDYTGTDIQVFYEPDVRIAYSLTDKNGNPIDKQSEISPGEYTLNYHLADSVTNKDVSNSPLLAPVSLQATMTNNGKSQQISSGQKIQLESDKDTRLLIKGTFLKDYEISNEYDSNSNDGKLNIVPPALKTLTLSFGTEQIGNWFKTSDYENWKPLRIDLTYGGEKLTDEQLKAVSLSLDPDVSENLMYTCKPVMGQSAYEITLGKNNNGEYVQPEYGKYSLQAKAVYTDEFQRSVTAEDSITFHIQWYSQIWVWLFWIVLLAVLILLIIFLLNLPAWPYKMVCVIEKPTNAGGTVAISPSGGTMRLVPFRYELAVSVKKNSKLKDKFSSRASVKVTEIMPHRKVQSVTIGANTYTRNNKFREPTGETFRGIVIRNGTQISMTFAASQPLTARIKINKK